MSVLISVDELSLELGSANPPVVLDVRWSLGAPSARPAFISGHIPTAVFVDLETDLAAHGDPTEGRHPLPAIEDLEKAARSWGIEPDSTVVVYDATGSTAACRAWWLLRWAGLADVRILDGGLPAWVAEEFELESGEVAPRAGEVTLTAGHMPTLNLDDVATTDLRLLDARAGERYRGETEPVDPKAGHIPGALSAPTSENLTADGHFLPASVLRRRFETLGVRADISGNPGVVTVAVYCGSGVTAAHEIAALEIAGFKATIFPGSWSQWSNHDLPVETGY